MKYMYIYLSAILLLAAIDSCNGQDVDSLNELKTVFEPPVNFSDVTQVTFTADTPEDFLDTVPMATRRLYILLSFKGISYKWNDVSINLTGLHRFPDLRELWLVPDPDVTEGYKLYSTLLSFKPVNNANYSLHEFHFNLPMSISRIHAYGGCGLINLLQVSKNLEVLDLSGARFLNKDSFLVQICYSLRRNPVKALSLELFQDTYESLVQDTIRIFNFSKLFKHLKQSTLEYLDLSHNGIHVFAGSIIKVAPKLRILDVSFNNIIHYQNLPFLFEAFLLHPHLELFNANMQHRDQQFIYDRIAAKYTTASNRHRRDITSERIRFKTTLTHCINENNTNAVLSHKSEVEQWLRKTDLNKICSIVNCILHNITERKDVRISCEVLPSLSQMLQLFWTTDRSCPFPNLPVSPKLTEINVDFMSLFKEYPFIKGESLLCLAQNKLRKFSMSNSSPLLHGSRFDRVIKHFNIKGMENVTDVSLSHNKLRSDLTGALFRSLPGLKRLDLAGNYIHLHQNFSLGKLFPKLQHIDLSYNGIGAGDISLQTFKDLPLTHINLAGNKLDKLNIQLDKIPGLIYLNLSFAHITILGDETMNGLRFSERKNNLTVDLTGNNLLCTCSSTHTVEVISQAWKWKLNFVNSHLTTCIGSNGLMFLHSIDVRALANECSNIHTIISITLSNVFLILLAIVTVLCYRYRYRIKTLYFRLKLRVLLSRSTDRSSTDFNYDALISFCSKDRFWVKDVLMSVLEGKYGFKLFCRYRDSDFGPTADLIVDNIQSCRCVIVVLSSDYLQKEWSIYEMEVAHTQSLQHNKHVIFIKLEEIESQLVAGLVKQILDSKVYIEWPDVRASGCNVSSLDDRRKHFWARISHLIYSASPALMTSNPCTADQEL